MLIRINQILLLLMIFVGGLGSPLQAQQNIIKEDWPMFADPVMPQEYKILVVGENLISTWIDALASEDTEIRIDTVQTLRLAAQKNIPGLEVTIDPLIAVVADSETPKTIRYTAASVLTLLDASKAKEVFISGIKKGEYEMSVITESSLIKWQAEELVDIWRGRFESPKSGTLLRLAINGLAALGNDEDRKLLVEFSRNATNGNALRIDAAQAIAMYSEVPYLLEAAELLNGSTVDLIVAANLASPAPAESNQSQALQVLKQLCASSAYAAAGIAADALRQWNKVAVVELADVLATHQNPRARNAYVTALHDTVTAENLATLGSYLDDGDPGIRVQVQKWLVEFAEQDTLLPGVLEITEGAVNAQSWRLQEQGMHLAVELEQKHLAPVALKLLRSDRAEVLVTASWALRRLAVPETLPQVLAYCQSRRSDFLKETLPRELEYEINEQFAHLYQMFGQMKYKPATQLLMQFTKKVEQLRFRIRASAGWALGKIWEDDLEGASGLQDLFLTRLTDEAPIPPEDNLVKRMCAIGLARIGSDNEATIDALELYREQTTRRGVPSFSPLYTGSVWALTKLTGKTYPDPVTETFNEGPWLIQPFDPKLLESN